MSYKFIKEKLHNGKLVILDGAMGSELEKNGAQMDKDLWCGTSSVKFPEIVKKVHEDYINAGVDVITTNTYASTPISEASSPIDCSSSLALIGVNMFIT